MSVPETIGQAVRRIGLVVTPVLAIPFPRRCPVCGSNRRDQSAIWCAACGDAIGEVVQPICTHCHRHRPFDSSPCTGCGSVQAPVATLALGVFDHAWRAIVHAIKYHEDRDLAVAVGMRMAAHMPESHDRDLIVPVPTHPHKRRERGFGHAETIASSLASELHIPVETDTLRFTRRMRDQTRLRGVARMRNLHEALTVSPSVSVEGRRVLIVDDVTTTGATLREAGRALTNAGATSVLASVVCLNLGMLPDGAY